MICLSCLDIKRSSDDFVFIVFGHIKSENFRHTFLSVSLFLVFVGLFVMLLFVWSLLCTRRAILVLIRYLYAFGLLYCQTFESLLFAHELSNSFRCSLTELVICVADV